MTRCGYTLHQLGQRSFARTGAMALLLDEGDKEAYVNGCLGNDGVMGL